ncbi:hypothetical protein B0T26DRAFT_643921 [Lasiosphaeria miniovina]|uniref:Nephrocystin 3-like N-terminal domain-containing protein n=1 Tax=Lasiosphaeria miniovina TaxID=1954250 RepID=A0AA40E206_9PEZI|nr:uncharacterized protein B0T26DRAFT_643921 [Lasiosphaeria miniovina]KAK0722062.1 hypothetical protein B0T26DRAFT_643921 [Lasiosphaeria miniovina]
MDTIRAGLHESMNGLAGKAHKPSDAVSIAVSTVSAASDSDGSTKTAHVVREDETLSSVTAVSHSQSSTASIQITRLIDTSRAIRGHICGFEEYNETFFKSLDLESYLACISDHRLVHMPPRGSDWDRVLKSAQFFGLQLWRLGSKVDSFCFGAEVASVTALGSTQVLLEIGPRQAKALLPTFKALYKLAILISNISQINDIFSGPREVKEAVAHLYCDLVELVGDIAVLYRKRISNLKPGASVVLNFEASFGSAMAAILKRRDQVTAKLWSLKLGSRATRLTLEAIRHRLKQDRSARGAFYDQVSDSVKRAEGTCEWLKSPLVEFFRSHDKALTITGDIGTGKTFLSGWIEERLQRPLDHAQHSALAYSFPFDSPAGCTPLAFLKSILFQLLEKNVGDVGLYDKLVAAFEAYDKHHSTEKLESSLWTALESGLRTLNNRLVNLVIVVDGFHDIIGPQTPLDFHKALRGCIGKFKTIRMITLSKAISHLSDGCRHFIITPQHLQVDIKAYFRQRFAEFQCFGQLKPEAKEKTLHELSLKAKSSFIWAYLVAQLLAKESLASSPEAFSQAAHHASTSSDEILKKLVARISLKNDTTEALLCFMLAADRPLSVAELSELLRVDIKARRFGVAVDVPKHIKSACSDIVVIENGSVHFKSRTIRTYMHGLMGKSLPAPRDAQHHLTLVLLLYSKLTLSDVSEPSFDLLGDTVMDQSFHSHALLYYAVRHWQSHFRASSFYGAKGELVLTKDFHEVFPASCHFALLERSSCYHNLTTPSLVEFHDFSLKVREACFGQKHISVLQILIILGNIHITASDTLVGAKFFYRAVSVGKVILPQLSAVVVTCANYFLQYTGTITITTRTEIVTYREEMILFMIEICKGKHGTSSDLVIKWYEVLAKLYVDIKEEFRATLIYKELYEIYVVRFGKKSPQARRLTEHLGGLNIVLKGETKTDVKEYAGFLLGATEDLNMEDELRISILLRLALFYESQKQWYLAENLYIKLWRHISEVCRIKATIELHITKITIAVEYVRFLQRLKRTSEACNILICLWAEYEHHSFEEKKIIVLIREVGVLFKVCGLLDVAISILTKVWGWFRGKGKVDDEDAVQTTILITEVVEEIIQTTMTTKTTNTTTTETTETVVREIFETHLTRCKKSKADAVFFKSCVALANLYIKLQNWAHAEIVIKQTLEITWKAILTVEVTIETTEHFASECILVATRLAVCYHQQRLFDKAESIYLRIFHACLASLHLEDVRIEETLAVLIKFYEEHHRHEKVIEVYVELLARYRKQLGHTHKLTIKVLYALAAHCELLGRHGAYDYYIEIVTVLNKHKKHCHHDAFQAAVVLVRYYHERKCWTELQHICHVLWETFLHHHKEVHFSEGIIQLVFEKYVYVLEFHAKVELSVLYDMTKKFHETVTVVFGVAASIVIVAMLSLAKICERHEKHYQESITIYEEVIKRITTTKTTTTTTTETTINTVKKRLSKVYVTLITSGSSKTTVTVTTIERAIVICLESYAQLRIELGCWHEKTLFKLKDVIVLYQKLGSKESHAKIIELLQVAIIAITTTTCGSLSLYHAAATLASIYITAGLAKQGLVLVRHLRHLVIFGEDFEISTEIKVTLDTSSITKAAFVFLVSFEQRITEKIVMTFSELMASTLLEISLYEQYKKVIEIETDIEIVLQHGSRLRAFWAEQREDHLLAVLDKKLFHIFKTKYSAFITTHDDYTRIFYLALLAFLAKDEARVDFAALACKSGNAKVAELLESGDFKKALEVAKCTFHFADKQKFYGNLQHVRYAYRLAELMAGIDARKPTDAKLWAEFLKLSKEITNEALAIFKANGIDFVRLRFEDLSEIVRLLGSQQNYGELEALLLKLWQSREVQKTWHSGRVLSIGKLMVHAHVAAKNIPAAIELADIMCYNLRRSRGVLDPVTVEMSQMLAALYTSDNRVGRSIDVHEQILREIEAALRKQGQGHGHHERTYQAAENGGSTNGHQQILLKRAHLRLGGWTKSEQEFTELYSRLAALFSNGDLKGPSPDTWSKAGNKDKPDDMIGKYVGPREWETASSTRWSAPTWRGWASA